jgi:hypothetical protein
MGQKQLFPLLLVIYFSHQVEALDPARMHTTISTEQSIALKELGQLIGRILKSQIQLTVFQ